MTNKPNWKAAIFAKCPACGKAGAFKGLLTIADNCTSCGHSLSKYETADGPAFFAISFIGPLVGILTGVVEVIYEPALWVHLTLWIPVIFIGSFIVIRMSKTLMIAHQMSLEQK